MKLYNTRTRKEEEFVPLNPGYIGMYVCGPTVYDRPHLGNARSVLVYDMLFRLLKLRWGNVKYVRNITDVDDKINAAAKAGGEPISALTSRITSFFHEDMAALMALSPVVEPRATAHIGRMAEIIKKLIENGHAYENQGHVLFSVASDPAYGKLSGRSRDEMIAGARVEIAPYKKDPADFVLWKPAEAGDDPSSEFDSPWGKGRPGWHIECTAMSTEYLGESYDIHGGGSDLIFPHHENEVAQSTCAFKGSAYANFWVHNGFLTVNGEKMSKSLGNFITVRDLLGKGEKGEAIRYALLSTHYRKPLDFTPKLLDDAKKALDGFYRAYAEPEGQPDERIIAALEDDLNTPKAYAALSEMLSEANKGGSAGRLAASLRFMGFFGSSPDEWFGRNNDGEVERKINQRLAAKKARDFAAADCIRDELKAQGIEIEDKPGGITEWRKV